METQTKEFCIRWVDCTEYETTIEATSREEALELFKEGNIGYCKPTGWVETETDSIEIFPLDSEDESE